MKQLYVINSCNIWKEYSSMHLVSVTGSKIRAKQILIQKIREGDMEYTRRSPVENPSKYEQIKALKADWDNRGAEFVFDAIEYGYIQGVTPGEIL